MSNLEHLVPSTELGRHELSERCACEPFVYTRLLAAGDEAGTEVRHNSFAALPVDEEALEKVQSEQLHG